MKHYTIPFFITHSGCPQQCVFCDQQKITGKDAVTPGIVDETIKKYLSTIKKEENHIEVGFFGGTFTGLSLDLQGEFLGPIEKYIKDGVIKSIRLSTRPDYISKDIVRFLKERYVKCIELGVQSMSDKVLKASKRGYTEQTVEKAADIISELGLDLGFQMMLGLPGSSEEEEFYTAKKAKQLKAPEVRIYPLVVMKDTELAKIWAEGGYVHLQENEATKRAAKLIVYFETNNIKVIRCGLHPSEGLINHENYLAGPFHPAFRQKAESWIFSKILKKIDREITAVEKVYYNPRDAASFFGFEKMNRESIRKIFSGEKLCIGEDKNIPRGNVKAFSKDTEILFGKKDIAEDILSPDMLA